ncbi:MAG: MarR family winged helix-turn-helix transcriptional regulator [Solirubrobacterales bacterium]
MTLPPNTPIDQIPLPGLLEMASEAIFAEFRVELIEAGYGEIRPTHGCVFRFVHDEGMRLTELASLARMTKQSIGEIVDDLADRGYVERIPDPEDKRAKLIRLTEKGEQAQATGRSLFAKLEQRFADRYGSDRVADLRELLEEVATQAAPQPTPA